MNRRIVFGGEIPRAYDFLKGWKDAFKGLGFFIEDIFSGGVSPTVVAGFGATPTNPLGLSINLAQGTIYQVGQVDPTQYGDNTSGLVPDSTVLARQGYAAAQTLTFSTSAIGAGQSQWVLVEVSFVQQDIVPSDDPNSGVLPYFNPANPAQPLQGPNNLGTIQDTERQDAAVVRVSYGIPATTGINVPPGVDSGFVPLYLINLNFGQTQIVQTQIQIAGPQTYGGFQQAPFLAGFLNQHHLGTPGSAPKIQLSNGQEIQGIVPLANLFASNVIGTLPTMRSGTQAPQGNVSGNFLDLWLDTSNGQVYVCVQTGNAITAIWSSIIAAAPQPPFSNAQLSGPALSGVTAGVGIAVTSAPISGVGTQQISTSNVPNSVMNGPLVTGLLAGSNITINDTSPTGVRQVTISATFPSPTGFSQSTANPGWFKLPNGMMMQWVDSVNMSIPVGGNTTFNINLPQAFPTAGLTIMPQLFNFDNPNGKALGIETMVFTSNSQVAINVSNGGDATAFTNIRVWCIGY